MQFRKGLHLFFCAHLFRVLPDYDTSTPRWNGWLYQHPKPASKNGPFPATLIMLDRQPISQHICVDCRAFLWPLRAYYGGMPQGVNPLPPRPGGTPQKGHAQLLTIDFSQKTETRQGGPFSKNFYPKNFPIFLGGTPFPEKRSFQKIFPQKFSRFFTGHGWSNYLCENIKQL